MENDKMKSSRASQSRTKEVKKTTWTPPSPDGYKHRWLRAEVLGFDDTKNMAGHLRSGFELVRAEEYPNSEYPVIKEGKYQGMIGVGGLLLGRIPNEVVEARKEYFARMTQEKTDAIDKDLMKEEHPSMPINSERQTRVTFGGTKKS
jgi:hypothetical protein